MVGIIQKHAPKLFKSLGAYFFDTPLGDGTMFHCSTSFVQKYITNNLNWSFRASTRAAQKVLENAEELTTEAALREEAYCICNYNIPAALQVNTAKPRTSTSKVPSATWHQKGDHQVPVVGFDEKCAFILIPSISADGELLPFQEIYQDAISAS
ncbi:hypothetical protein BT96DRAFT_818226 [Gymnopus androsaceus JB14]|uniref:Uncharacterized protein n=1 Tax=Gymnopus androsaceus JB14 TaxID=1447944 RepID=A0A6A4HQC7_9AGAR|nr:hypothetical protein BT96DRAFT_818226 [Gymnopus androsaceus JB14]